MTWCRAWFLHAHLPHTFIFLGVVLFHVEHDLCSWASCLLPPDYRNISPLRLLFTLNWTFLFSLTLKSPLPGVCCLSSHSLNSILSRAFTLSNNQFTSYCCFSCHDVSLSFNTVGFYAVPGLFCCLMEVWGLHVLSLLSTPTGFSTIAVTVCFAALLLPFSQKGQEALSPGSVWRLFY